jgi:hypothetical protein
MRRNRHDIVALDLRLRKVESLAVDCATKWLMSDIKAHVLAFRLYRTAWRFITSLLGDDQIQSPEVIDRFAAISPHMRLRRAQKSARHQGPLGKPNVMPDIHL